MAAQITQHNLDKAEVDASIGTLDGISSISPNGIDTFEIDASIDALEATLAAQTRSTT